MFRRRRELVVTDETPGLESSACRAPSTALYFDQHGDVRACCHNLTAVLGNVRLDSIRAIWEGAPVQRLRAALARDDFSMGCGVCEWQDQGDRGGRFARAYDSLDPTPGLEWPRQMEFAISNACNLQCVMCTGWNSSAIRAHREGLPPLDNPYGDEFFEQLEPFLPHLEKVVLLGGEPFLGAHFLRLLEMLTELVDPPRVTVITNGTQWTPRVQRICERLPIDLHLSLDAATKSTFESIRLGASFDEVMGHLDEFVEYAARKGTTVGLSFCMMPTNALELIDLLEMAETKGLDFVSVNDVKFPPEHSPYHLPDAELAALVASLDAQVDRAARLGRFQPVWSTQVERLHQHLEERSLRDPAPVTPWTLRWDNGSSPVVEAQRMELAEWSGVEPTMIRGSSDFVLSEIEGPIAELLGDGAAIDGSVRLTSLLDRIGHAHGTQMAPMSALSGAENEVSFHGIRDGQVRLELRTFMYSDGGDLVTLVASRPVD